MEINDELYREAERLFLHISYAPHALELIADGISTMDEDNGKAIYFVSDTLKDQLEELRKLLFKGKWESEEEDDEADDSRFVDEDFIDEDFIDEDK